MKHPEPGATNRTRSFGFISVLGNTAAQAILGTSHTIDGANVGYPEAAKEHKASGSKANNDPARDTSERDAGGGQGDRMGHPPTRKVFVGGLSHQTKENALYTYFSQFGTLSDVVVMTEGSARRPRGFGFVTFEDAASVARVTRSRFHPIGGRHVEVKPAVPREQMRALEVSQQEALSNGAVDLSNFAPPEPGSGYLTLPGATGGAETTEGGDAAGYGFSSAANLYAAPSMYTMPGPYGMALPVTGVPVFNGYSPQMHAGFAPGGLLGAAPAPMVGPSPPALPGSAASRMVVAAPAGAIGVGPSVIPPTTGMLPSVGGAPFVNLAGMPGAGQVAAFGAMGVLPGQMPTTYNTVAPPMAHPGSPQMANPASPAGWVPPPQHMFGGMVAPAPGQMMGGGSLLPGLPTAPARGSQGPPHANRASAPGTMLAHSAPQQWPSRDHAPQNSARKDNKEGQSRRDGKEGPNQAQAQAAEEPHDGASESAQATLQPTGSSKSE